MDKTLNDYLDEELNRIETERREAMSDKGYAPFAKLGVGETKLTLQPIIPRMIKGGFGDRKAFKITISGIEYDWAINPRSPMYRQLLVLLRTAPIEITVIKVGEGKNTRYDIKT